MIETHKSEEQKRKGMGEKELFFYSTGYYFKGEFFLRCYSNCYSALHVKRATVANLKIFWRWRGCCLLEGFFCVFALHIGDALTPLTETENQNLKSTILFHSHSSNCFRYSRKKKVNKKYILYSNKQCTLNLDPLKGKGP